MRELSAFVDEFGNLGDDAKYYLLALVLHDQSKDVFECIGRYGAWLRVPRHLRPLTLLTADEDLRPGICELLSEPMLLIKL